jgi:hypothetical protein
MIRFLSSNEETNKVIKTLFGQANSICCAVAFWGKSAEDIFSTTKNKDIRVICNLFSGATNPAVIEELRKLTLQKNIKMHNSLHAKVYWTEKGVVIGSSNASVNGLALQGPEITGWKEASILVNDQEIINEIGWWFEELFDQSNNIKTADLIFAQEQWAKARDKRLRLSVGDKKLKKELQAGAYTDRNIFVVIDSQFMGPDEVKAGNKKVKILRDSWPNYKNENVSYWLDFDDLPRNAIVYSYFVEDNKIFENDVHLTLDKKHDQLYKKGQNFQFCIKANSKDGGIEKNQLKDLKNIVKSFYERNKKEVLKKAGYVIHVDDLITKTHNK